LIWSEFKQFLFTQVGDNVITGNLAVLTFCAGSDDFGFSGKPFFQKIIQGSFSALISQTVIDQKTHLSVPIQAFFVGLRGMTHAVSIQADLSPEGAIRPLVNCAFVISSFVRHF
jgi:hypothetical protein